jgi:hypothetical protein
VIPERKSYYKNLIENLIGSSTRVDGDIIRVRNQAIGELLEEYNFDIVKEKIKYKPLKLCYDLDIESFHNDVICNDLGIPLISDYDFVIELHEFWDYLYALEEQPPVQELKTLDGITVWTRNEN